MVKSTKQIQLAIPQAALSCNLGGLSTAPAHHFPLPPLLLPGGLLPRPPPLLLRGGLLPRPLPEGFLFVLGAFAGFVIWVPF